MQQVNLYRCSSCGHKWMDIWGCACSDTCRSCGTRDIEPYGSVSQDEVEQVAANAADIHQV